MLAHSTQLYGWKKNKTKTNKQIYSEGQRRPVPGAADANLCTSSRGRARPDSQQLAKTKAHV